MDHGPGIDRNNIPLVFGKFTQIESKDSGKIKATGLGLSFCKMALEAHGQKIGVESEIGKGSDFWFSFEEGTVSNLTISSVNENTKETILELNELDKNKLLPFIKDLSKLEVYDTSEINNILDKIDIKKSKGIKQWKSEIEHCLFTLNEKNFDQLIRKIKE